MSKFSWVCVCAGMLAIPVWAQPSVKYDFEATNALPLQMYPGKASEGSSLALSEEKAHSGKKSVKVHYEFTGTGYLQFSIGNPAPLPKTDKVKLSAWIYGTGLSAFSSGAIRFIDANNETFQYRLAPEFAAGLNGEGWQQVQVEIDLNKPMGHWGDNSDGIVDQPMKFLGFAFDSGSPNPIAGSIYLDDLQLAPIAGGTTTPATGTAAATPTTLNLLPVWTGTSPEIYLYAPGSTVAVRATTPQKMGTLAWTARDFENRVVAQGTVPIQSETTTWNLPPGKPGIWYVTAEVKGNEGAVLAREETRVAFTPVAKTSVPNQPLIWGMNAHLNRATPTDLEREAALMASLGFNAVRAGSSWLDVQRNNAEQWDWTNSDQIYKTLARYNIKTIQMILGTPRWASSGDIDAKDWRDWAYLPPKRMEDLAAYLRATAERYDKQVAAYEIWNEPDISFWRGTPEQYAQYYDAAQTAIKSVNPRAKVMNGGFSETKRQPNFIPYFTSHITQKPDIFAYHTHQQFSNLVRAGDDVKNYLSEAKWQGMPVWLNEAGFSSSGQLTERDQVSALLKKYTYAASLGYAAYFWYDLRNDGTDPNELEHNFGLVRRDFTPKASAVAARTLTAQLGGKRFVRRLPSPPNIYALLFEGKNANGKALSTAIVWNEASSGAQLPLFWTVPGKATRTTAMGQSNAVATRGGVALTTASPMPEFLDIEGPAANIKLVQNVFAFDGAVLAAPGSTEKWRLVLTNPLNEALKGQVKLTAQDGWKVPATPLAFNLPPKGKREFLVPITAPATAPTSSLKVQIASASLPTQIVAVARLLPATSISRFASRAAARFDKPTVSLGRANTVSLFEATPMQELHFHGDADLSAQANLARVPEGLLLSLQVQDDIHVQKEVPGVEWQGDSLQFALSLPTGQTYEWMVALGEDGPHARLVGAPAGIATGPVQLPLTIRREGTKTLYDLVIPSKLPGNGPTLPDRFSFSFLVNDNDGGGRKGWIEWTPGIGRSKDPTQYKPLVVH